MDAWGKLPKDLIEKSFKRCGLNLPNNGSQDDQIHCFKEGKPGEADAAMFKEQLAIMDDPSLKINPFLEISESDIEEANDLCLLLDYFSFFYKKRNKLLNYKN